MFGVDISNAPDLVRTACFWLWVISLAVLVISMVIDRRRFRNCFYLLFHLGASALLLIISTWGTASGTIILVLLVLFNIFLFLILPMLLIVNGFFMIKREGFRIPNLLSLFFGIMIFAGEYSLLINLTSMDNTPLHFAILVFGILIFYTCVIFLSFLLYSELSLWIPKQTTFDYVIVHGCGLIHGSQVSPLLEARIRKGIEVYRRSMSSCKLICSGGKGGDETVSEADAMKTYMLNHGVPESDIVMENGSANTIQNLKNSMDIIEKRGGRMRIALVTSSYHVLRSLIYTAKLNLNCTGFGARVALYYWPSAMIREFIALMKEYLHWYAAGLVLSELPFVILFLSFHA